ncbi:MAG TPA: Gfo/Idh/MocA family oxidoreductase [Candidatus Limnocylindrales bacterium]|nr:Gfo/Idh/MocA family oxidoreductase [Candidatus Limnocylindrales bacterium]
MTARPPAIGIALVGAGTMAAAHGAALTVLGALYPSLPRGTRLVAVADVNERLAARLAGRFGFERVERDWRRVVEAPDVDLVVACLPPVLNHEVVVAAAAAGKHVVSEKPLAESAAAAMELLEACRAAGVFHGLGAAYRWNPALRAIRRLIDDGQLGEIRSLQACFMLDYAADPEVPLLWRFQRALAGGGIGIDTGYHIVDCARYLVGEIVSVQSLTKTFIAERPLPAAGAIGNRGGVADRSTGAPRGTVDVEDAAAALVTFAGGAYGVLETSRVAIGRRVSLRLDVFGSTGSAAWDLEQPDEFRVCLPGDPGTFGYRRVLVNPTHPGAAELLIGGTDGTSIGWLGQGCAMWAEFLTAIAEGRQAHADFEDGVRDNAVIDAIYASAASGMRTPVTDPAGLDPALQGVMP